MLDFNFADDWMTPFEVATINSYTEANKIIETLKQAVKRGIDPNDVDIDYSNIEDVDLKRIKYEVEEFAREWYNE